MSAVCLHLISYLFTNCSYLFTLYQLFVYKCQLYLLLQLFVYKCQLFVYILERQMWGFESPLRQHPSVKSEVLTKMESRNFTIDKLRELDAKEVGHLIHHVRAGSDVKKAAFEVPMIEIEATIQPITRTVLRVKLLVIPKFRWNDR